jgi:putative ABC transport system ATP-binding protein
MSDEWKRPAVTEQAAGAGEVGQAERWPEFAEPPPETTALLDVRGVSKTYRRGSEEVRALQGASLSLHPGEVVALVGPSGSGKSTLLNVISGWELPDDGEILWSGKPAVGKLANLKWGSLAILPQSIGLLEDLPVRENVTLPVRLGKVGRADRSERATLLLETLGLAHLADRDPEEISLGEQQRAGLARALVLSPRLLLADEPTGHQDEEWARGVFRAIRMAASEGTACLVATHHHEAVVFADRVVAIRDGHLRSVQRGQEGTLTAE